MRHKTAMLISTHKAVLAELPRAGEEWRWVDVVDVNADGDGIDKSVAMRSRSAGLIESVGDGDYRTTRRLDEYLEQKHGVELTGHRDDDDPGPDESQSTPSIDVPESTRTGSSSDVCHDDDGDEDEDEVPA